MSQNFLETTLQSTDDVPFRSLIPDQNNILRDETKVKRSKLSEDYEIAEPNSSNNVLGQGVSGQVIKLRNKTTGNIVAMKQIKVSDTTAREVTLHYIAQENCRYITKIYDIYINRCRGIEYFYLLMELCDGGELFDAITGQNNRNFNERQVANIIRQIATALEHLHLKLGIAHRDLKPENVLLKSRDPSVEVEVRLTDFGFAKQAKDPSNASNLKTACYTPYYASPEIFSNQMYDVACDIWSLGVILYIMLTGEPPFFSMHGRNAMTPNMRNNVMRGNFKKQGPKWERLSEEAKDLILKMLLVNSEERIKIAEVKQHRYLTLDLLEIPENVIDYGDADPEGLKDINKDIANELVNMRVDDDEKMTQMDTAQLQQAKAAKNKDKTKKKFGPKKRTAPKMEPVSENGGGDPSVR